MEKAHQTRWLVAIGGIICQFCAGMIYSWSLYVNPLMAQHGWEKSSVTLTFSITTLLIPILMIFAGKAMQKIGPRNTTLIGAVFLALGPTISAFATSLPMLYLGYGVFCGIGVGFIYGVPIATSVKWFPEKKGLISGLTVAGFGLGSIIFSPICTILIESLGLNAAFFIQSGISIVGMLIGSSMLKTAPDGYRPEGWVPPAQQAGALAGRDYTSSQMLRTQQYWFLLIMYLFANVAGLFIIGHASPIAQEIASLTALQAGAIVSVLSIANTLGRFIGGAASDKLGAAKVVTIIYAADLVLFLCLRFMTGFATIAFGIGGLAVCFGAMMGAYPSIVLDYFGGKHYSTNYAFVFLAYGIGGLLANTVASMSMAHFDGYYTAFLIIGVSCAVGCVMSRITKKPVASEVVTT